ncbi:hypothetical protein EBQ91_00760, partial [bacterium]|nr:hypothetical protein [bacterium]
MTVLTYAQIVTLTEQMVQKSEKSFSKADYKAIVRACEQDVILARLLQAYPPLKFKMFYDRAREADLAERQAQQQARAAHQQQMVNVNVHDPLFGDSRKATRTWLQTQSVVASADSIKASLESEYQPYFLTLFEQQISKGLIGRLYPKSSEEEQRKITQDFRYFVEYLFESYKKGATGGETLIQSVQAALARETEVDKEDALMILFSSLNQARTGYEGSASKYIGANHPLSKGQARDWSCMPGVDERILDGLTPMRLSQEAAQQDESLSIEDRYIQSLAHVFIRKTADGLLPSPLFYSLVLQALPLPATSGLQVEAQESYRFTLAQGVERETVVQQYLAESKKQKDKKLKTIAKALLGKEDYSLVDLHQAVFHQYDGETAQQKAIRLQYKRDLSSLGFEQDLDGTPAEQNSHLEKSINEVLEQRASDFIASVLNMSYESEQEATDYLKRTIPGLTLPGLTLVAAERKDVLVIRNQSGHEQDIAAL